jgi:multiple sugar transport system substrate-binding protein
MLDAMQHPLPQRISLRGMTWSDPRGYDPLIAASAAFGADNAHVTITWDKRSLQGFESTPIEDLAAVYDLMVIDHPHIGAAARQGCLLPLDHWASAQDLDCLQGETVGKSYASYALAGHQWALPIDAATQVQAIRPDLRQGPARTWADVISSARSGAVLWPLRPPHVLMSFFTLTANLGQPCAVTRGPLVPRETGIAALRALQDLFDLVDPACREMDPIAALDALAGGTRHSLIAHCYLYAGYGRAGYRAQPIAFHDIPSLGPSGPIGSALGGTGIAISARTQHAETCAKFAVWLASATVQRGVYAQNNGQPANARAWGDGAVDAAVGHAYSQSRMTHEAAWLRPRHDGYMAFQEAGSHILLDALQGKTSHAAALNALDAAFQESFSL